MNPQLLIKVPTLSVLFGIKLVFPAIASFCKENGIKGLYPYTDQTMLHDSTFHARQFNPLAGINEDPVTGVAGAALAGSYGKDCIIEQGHCMNAFGRMFIRIDLSIQVSGHAVKADTRYVEL